MEPLLVSLQKSEAAKIQLLRTLGIRDLSEAIAKQPTSREKEMALHLLEKLQQVMKGLKKLNGRNQELLKRNMQYIDFNINVITQATAGTTYGASGGQPAQPDGGMKMFDTNI
jgi:flagellar biosynthesis/type III secretory pathway chaperone